MEMGEESNYEPGQQAVPQTARNESLIEAYLAVKLDGKFIYSLKDLIAKFKVSKNRIYELLDRNNITRRHKHAGN